MNSLVLRRLYFSVLVHGSMNNKCVKHKSSDRSLLKHIKSVSKTLLQTLRAQTAPPEIKKKVIQKKIEYIIFYIVLDFVEVRVFFKHILIDYFQILIIKVHLKIIYHVLKTNLITNSIN